MKRSIWNNLISNPPNEQQLDVHRVQDSTLRIRGKCYILTGVIVHKNLALIDGGHYTCFFLNHSQRQWFHADDSQVGEVVNHETNHYLYT